MNLNHGIYKLTIDDIFVKMDVLNLPYVVSSGVEVLRKSEDLPKNKNAFHIIFMDSLIESILERVTLHEVYGQEIRCAYQGS